MSRSGRTGWTVTMPVARVSCSRCRCIVQGSVKTGNGNGHMWIMQLRRSFKRLDSAIAISIYCPSWVQPRCCPDRQEAQFCCTIDKMPLGSSSQSSTVGAESLISSYGPSYLTKRCSTTSFLVVTQHQLMFSVDGNTFAASC